MKVPQFFQNNKSKKVVHKYDYLLQHPRYVPEVIILDGREFKIPDSISFYYAYREIFEIEIYRFPCHHDHPVILDCGANTGISVAYFKKIFPKCVLTAVEADPVVYGILSENINNFGLENITLIQGALSAEGGKLPFMSEGADAGRLPVGKETLNSKIVLVNCIHLDDMITAHVDFLKIDIEGAEVDVLLNTRKLDEVERMFVEYHSFIDSPQRLDELLNKISSSGFRYYITVPATPKNPFERVTEYLGMDLQLNISCVRI